MVLLDHLAQARISFYDVQEVHNGITPKCYATNTKMFSFHISIDKKSPSLSFFYSERYSVNYKHIIPFYCDSLNVISCSLLQDENIIKGMS